jgi:hypothetical protein
VGRTCDKDGQVSATYRFVFVKVALALQRVNASSARMRTKIARKSRENVHAGTEELATGVCQWWPVVLWAKAAGLPGS